MSEAPILDSKPWQKSLTIKGAVIGAAATFVSAKGAAILTTCGVDPTLAKELTGDLSGIMAGVAALMVAVGRLRLGDLH